jgi:glutamyl-Q tRNA(Asp) synthetase
MIYRGRFAPSPSGHLHIGSLTAAVGSWLCARHAAGPWLVRIEDIDPPREVEGSAASILAALLAFGPVADGEPLYQSRRAPAYDPAFEQLRDADRIFPCWCSRSDLAGSGGMHRDAHCVAAPDSAKPPAWRVRAPDIEIAFDDALQGPQKQNLREAAGDFVIRRAEGFHGYQLACVVDDAQQGMTEVVRGHDLLDSTARQIWLQQCLGLPPPVYRHLPLALDADGRKLSKWAKAFPLDPSNPLPALRQALGVLQSAVPAGARDADDLLAGALTIFDPALLPHCSGQFGP